MTLDTLISRLETVEEGSRELDAEIWRATCDLPAGYSWRVLNGEWCQVGPAGVSDVEICDLAYSTSLDAAMSLRPKGWTIANLGEGDSGTWWAELREGYCTSYGRVAMSPIKTPTAALALCIASLRARSSIEGGEHG